MEQLILPSTFTWKEGTKPNERVLTVEPCYFGYGTTLGNALRRVLLSSLPGAAATAVKIDGVSHEFSTIEHVQEDVMQILLNVKQLRLKVFTDEPVRLMLEAKGKREVTAGDITPQSDVEIVNPNLRIASLTHKDARLRMEIFVRRGRGYSTTDQRGKERLELGTMAIDAAFTPIRSVGFRVENTRVGEITNYDRLILTVETDGTLTPEEAVHQATKLLIDHFTLILEPPKAGEATVEEAAPMTDAPTEQTSA
jgi:DNA-directed RNA polymerase subunit alpha